MLFIYILISLNLFLFYVNMKSANISSLIKEL